MEEMEHHQAPEQQASFKGVQKEKHEKVKSRITIFINVHLIIYCTLLLCFYPGYLPRCTAGGRSPGFFLTLVGDQKKRQHAA